VRKQVIVRGVDEVFAKVCAIFEERGMAR